MWTASSRLCELAHDPVLLQAEHERHDAIDAEEHFARKRQPIADRADVAQCAAQHLVRTHGVALPAQIVAEDGFRNLVEFAGEALEHVRAAIDQPFHQRGEDPCAAAQRFVGRHLLGNRPERGEIGKPDCDEYARRQNETGRRRMIVRGVALRDERHAQIDHAMIDDQPARRFDFAQRLGCGNAQARPAFDECLFLIGRIEQVDPDHFIRKLARTCARRACAVSIDGQQNRPSCLRALNLAHARRRSEP